MIVWDSEMGGRKGTQLKTFMRQEIFMNIQEEKRNGSTKCRPNAPKQSLSTNLNLREFEKFNE